MYPFKERWMWDDCDDIFNRKDNKDVFDAEYTERIIEVIEE